MMRFIRRMVCLSLCWSVSAFADTGVNSIMTCENVVRAADESWAYKSCLPDATSGNPKAQVVVGLALMTGVGVVQNQPMAVVWFQRAADQQYPAGYYQLGLAKLAGLGTAQDESGGMVLINKAAAAGSRDAKQFLNQVNSDAPYEDPTPPPSPKRLKNDCQGVGCGKPLDSNLR